MDLLAELAYVLSHYIAGLPKDFELALPKGSKIRQLFDMVAAGHAITEEAAADEIYQSPPNDKRYLMLKRNLINKLIEMVMEVNPEATTQENYQAELLVCRQRLAVSEKLLQYNVYHNAERIIGKVQQIADRHFLLDIQLACAMQLRTINALKGFPVETTTYQQAVDMLCRYYQYENSAQGLWQIMESKVKFFLSYTPEFEEEARKYLKQVELWMEEHQSPFMELYAYRLAIVCYRKSYNLAEWPKPIKELQQLVKHHKFLRTEALQLDIHLEIARYARASADLTKAEKALQRCWELSAYAAFNRFEVAALRFDLCMKQERYRQAAILAKEVYDTPQFQFLNPIDIAAWGIRTLFLYYIFQWQQEAGLAAQYLPHYADRSAVLQFLNDKQPISKDKRGYNLHLVLLRLLFQLSNSQPNQREELSSEGNKMLVYFQRHLKPIENHRTGIFFNMLARVASNGMDAQYIEKQEERFLARLQEVWPQLPYDDCELVPYERLWQMIAAPYRAK